MPTDTSKPLIVVCGATGAQGSSVVEYLLCDGGYRVRALTRNPDGASAKELRNRGVDVVMCDIGNPEQVVLAFTGAYAVYGVTNFWEHGEAAEIQQGKNLADAAKACGVRHFIWPSLPHVPVIEPRHWESKITVEKYLNDIGVPTTALLTPFFFENLWRVLPIKKLPDGTFRLDWFWPSETLVPSFAAEDIGAWALVVLKSPGTWIGQRLSICVQKPTPLDYAATLTEVLGVDVVPRQVSVAEFDAVRPYVPDDLWLNMKAFLDHPELWKDAIEPCRKLHLEAQTLEQYIANHREQILGAAEPMAQAVSGLLDSRTPGHVRSVIIKGIRPIGEQDPSLFVLNELNIWRLLNGHLHIALFLGITNLHRFDTGCTRPLAVSHYYERGTPRERTKFIRNTEPRLDCEARLTLLIGILRGLEHIHNQKVVHGDLKGDNVVIGTLGDKLMAKITDFGSSRLACLDCVSGNLSDPEGTVLWDSPEVGMEETGRTIWSDIWAAGCVALEVQLDTFPYTPRFEEPGNSHILIAMN